MVFQVCLGFVKGDKPQAADTIPGSVHQYLERYRKISGEVHLQNLDLQNNRQYLPSISQERKQTTDRSNFGYGF